MRPSISFQIQNQTISRTDTFHVVAASRNYLHAEFVFLTDEWDGVAKTALFEYSGGVKQMLLEDDRCMVPWEALAKPGILKVSVFGGDLITVGQAIVRVCESGYKDGSAPSPPTPDIYAQILDAANAAKEIAEGVRRDMDGLADRLPAAYEGETEIAPSFEEQVLPTHGKSLCEDIIVQPIKVTEVSNPSGGKTVSI